MSQGVARVFMLALMSSSLVTYPVLAAEEFNSLISGLLKMIREFFRDLGLTQPRTTVNFSSTGGAFFEALRVLELSSREFKRFNDEPYRENLITASDDFIRSAEALR